MKDYCPVTVFHTLIFYGILYFQRSSAALEHSTIAH